MKRTVALLITISILFGVLSFAAAEGADADILKEVETWVAAFSEKAGEGQILQGGKPINSSDGINSRYIFIRDVWTGTAEICVAVRTSETEVVFWQMPLNKNNISLALGTLDKNVPLCYVETRMVGEEPDAAMFIKDSDSSLPFPEYLTEAKRIVRSARYGKIGAEEPERDPVLALFPGIRWGMTGEEMTAEYGQGPAFPTSRGSRNFTVTILGKEVHASFLYDDERKLTHIGLTGSEQIAGIRDQLTETYNTLYGEAKRVNYDKALSGDYTENARDDCTCWIHKRTVVLFLDDPDLVVYKMLY